MINVTKTNMPEIEDYISYLQEIWKNNWITNNGKLVQSLENRLKEYLKIKNMVLVSNGTLAIQLALKSLNAGGEIITTPFTFSATTNAILWEGFKPIFVDIDPLTFNISPEEVEKKITDKTVAILAVHVYGNPCEIEKLEKIAHENNLELIYDAAHAFGVEYKNKSVLDFGDMSTLSFHATKVFNTIEGGAIVVNDDHNLEPLMLMRNHGIKSEEEVELAGTNAKMNEFQAAMGLCNLKNIDQQISSRKKLYDYYLNSMEDLNVKFQKLDASTYNYSYMPVCFENKEIRDKVYNELIKENINSRKYFYPLTSDYNFLKDNKEYSKENDLINARIISDGILCLPLYPDLELETVDKIVNVISNLTKMKVTSSITQDRINVKE